MKLSILLAGADGMIGSFFIEEYGSIKIKYHVSLTEIDGQVFTQTIWV